MARQSGSYKITGTIDNLCFYEMEGKFYVRTKSCLTAKRIKNDPAFKQTRYYASLLANASKIASSVYKELPSELKIKGLYRKITGQAMQLLKAGNTEKIVRQSLDTFYLPNTVKKERKVDQKVMQTFFVEILFQSVIAERLPIYVQAALVYPSSPP